MRLAIAALALLFRLYKLDTVPPGLYLDETLTARHAVAWRLETPRSYLGSVPEFRPGGDRTSNLYLAAASLVMKAFGDGFVAARLVSVLPSLASVALLFFLGRAVAGARAGAAASLLLAVSAWAARSGRVGWTQSAMTALQLGGLWALVRGRPVWAGVLLGAALHTYLAARLALAQAAAWLSWERRGRALALCLLAASPFLVLAAAHGAFNARVLEVAIPRERLGPTLLRNVLAHLLMFNVRGGSYARDNLPGAPLLDPATGFLFLLGLAAVLRQKGTTRRLMISWYAVCVLGGVLSESREGPPYVFRVGNLAPWACLAAGIGFDRLRERWKGAGLLLAGAACVNFWLLFVRGPACPDFGPAFGTVETQLGLWLSRHPEARPCLVYYGTVKALDAYHLTLWRPEVNGYNWYRPEDSAAALQLAAGLYRRSPERALDPLALRGDVDLTAGIPERLRDPAYLAVPPRLVPTVERLYRVERREDLSDALGRPLGAILKVSPGPPSPAAPSRRRA